jgi:fibronectin-binding autotransporter adhesin
MKNKTLLLSLLLILGSLRAEAQFYTWNNTVTNGLWNDTANWEEAEVPNAADSSVFFNNTAPTSVGFEGFTATIGDLTILTNVTLGSASETGGVLNLDSSSFPQPFLQVDGGTLRVFTGVTGSNGLEKRGPGTLSLLGNTNNLGFTGDVSLNAGKILINQDGSLGNAGNDLKMAGGTVLIYGTTNATGSTALGADRTITIAGGGQGGVEALSGHTLTIAGSIENDGSAAILRKYGTGTLVLAGPATYGGRTIISGGTLLLSTNVVLGADNIDFTATGTLNLAGLTPTIPALTFSTDTNATRVFTITNGAIAVSEASGNFSFNGAQGTTANLSGLSSYIFNGPNRTFSVQPSANNGSNNTNFVILAATGDGSNSITASGMTIGGAATSAGTANGAQLTLGKVNFINLTNLNIGAFNASGVVDVPSGVTNASLTIRSTDGTSQAGTIKIGETSSGVRSGSGILNIGSGTVDIAATNIQIGRHIANANNSDTNSALTFGGGSVAAANITLAEKSGTGTPTIIASINQAGGSVSASTLTMGVGSPTNALPVLRPTYNLNGGTLRAANIVAGFGASGTNFATGTTRRFNWGGGTIRPLDATTDLTVTGTVGGGGNIEFLGLGPETKTFTTDGSNNILLAATTWLNANGGDIRLDPGEGGNFTTTGSFTVGSAQFPNTNAFHTNVINASLTAASGTVNLTTASRIFGIGDRTNAGIINSFNVVGGTVNLGLTSNRMLVGNKSTGEVNVTGGSLIITGNQPIYVGGDISFGATGARGTWTVSGGAVSVGGTGDFVLGQNSYTATNNITTDSAGVLNINGGTFTTTRAITTGVNTNETVSTGLVNINGGTLAAGASVVNLLNVTTATVASNSTFDTGTFDSGISQNLAGTGILTVTGTGTLRLNGTNTPPVVVNAGATLGGTGSAGTVTVNGTLAPGAPDGDGTFTTTGTLTVPGTARFRVYGNGINDRLLASGGAALGGTVSVTIGDEEYIPASGDSFDLVDGTISGSPTLDLPVLEGGLTWVTNSFTSTGVLSITNGGEPTNNYANWLTNYPSLTGPDALGTADPDGDGFSNNLEYAFDGNPTVGTPALLSVTKSGSDAVFNFVARKNPPGGVTYVVQSTTNLTSGPWGSAGITPTVSTNQSGILIPADYERRQFSVPASGKDFYRVQGTIND